VTSAPGSVVRLAICDCLVASIDASAKTRCSAVPDTSVPTLRIDATDGDRVTVATDLVTAAAECGVEIHIERSAVFISFPR